MKSIIKILAYNRPGVLDRIAGIIRRQGWNIDSMTAGSTNDTLTQINLSLSGLHVDAGTLGGYLSDLYGVESCEECLPESHIMWETILFRYSKEFEPSDKLSKVEGVRIIDVKDGQIYMQYGGSPDDVEKMRQLLLNDAIPYVQSGIEIFKRESRE